MQRFASEIAELRALGFAESLPIHSHERTADGVARFESGRVGVAVEFCADASSPRYSVKPLAPDGGQDGLPVAGDVWDEIVRDVRRRAPLNDDD